MEILEHISHVQAALKESTSAAIARMAESVSPFLEGRALQEILRDSKLQQLWALAEGADPASTDKHGTEADADSDRAWKLHKSTKHHVNKKIKAHDDAEASNMYAAMKHDLAKSGKAQAFYDRADKHAKAREELGVKHDYAEEVAEAICELQEALEEAAADYAAKNQADVGDAAEKNLHSRRAFDRSQRATSPSEHRFAARGHREAADKNPELKKQHLRAADAHDKAAAAKDKEESLAEARYIAEELAEALDEDAWDKAIMGRDADSVPKSRNAFLLGRGSNSSSEHDAAARAHKDAADHVSKLKEPMPELVKRHHQAAAAHARASNYLKKKRSKSEALTPAQMAASDAERTASVAGARMAKLKQKMAAKQAPKMVVAWMESLDEAGYSDEVKAASMNAARATAKAKTSGHVDDHGTAAVAHRIARDLAKSGGHADLAAKHDDFHQKHVSGSKAAKVA